MMRGRGKLGRDGLLILNISLQSRYKHVIGFRKVSMSLKIKFASEKKCRKY